MLVPGIDHLSVVTSEGAPAVEAMNRYETACRTQRVDMEGMRAEFVQDTEVAHFTSPQEGPTAMSTL
jgi:hypothetical protein